MKIALAQLNYIVGDFEHNKRIILHQIRERHSEGAELVIFSELAICGYPPLDLLERKAFIDSCIRSVQEIAKEMPFNAAAIIGAPEINTNEEGKLLYNAAYLLHEGEIKTVVRKALLPTYDIFDEYRYFEPNREFACIDFKGQTIALTICEDLWDEQPSETKFSRSRLYTRRPMDELMKGNPNLVVNIAASPFASKRMEVKQHIFIHKAQKHKIPVLMVNQVGANTELIFDGGSLAVSSNGNIDKKLKLFEEDHAIVELQDLITSGNPSSKTAHNEKDANNRIAAIHDALVLGVRDYFHKSGLKKATLGLSGGIDSAVTLAIAAEALGNENMHVLLLPSQYSSDHSISDSEEMAKILGIKYDILPIEDIFNLYRSALKPVFENRPEDLTEENIQSRIRGTLLMALSNKLGHILLNTSNKSETAVGYGTLYGDMAGGLSVLGDVYKLDVYALAKYINRKGICIPEHIIAKPPSAELRPDQKDSDSLPEYEILDQILECYIEKQCTVDEIIQEGFEKEVVARIIKLVDFNEYKRYQTPPILRISSKAFGVGRRIPIVGKY
jgi:NAD+ synthase (glutamine-hydrolysing)